MGMLLAANFVSLLGQVMLNMYVNIAMLDDLVEASVVT
jgi:hypothetical protein